jgi:hypothetical protein
MSSQFACSAGADKGVAQMAAKVTLVFRSSMNNTVTGISEKIPRHLRDLFSSLLGEVSWIREQWQMYETLYGREDHCNLLNKSAPMFFYMVDYLFIDGFILALSRLGDPAKQTIKKQTVENFTLEQLLLRLDRTAQADLIQKLKPLLADYQSKCAAIREQRRKRVAHADFNTKMEADKHPLPDVSRQVIEGALMAAEDYLNRVECYFSGIDCSPSRNILTPDTAHTLLDRLYKAVAYDKLHAEGKIELGYAHKLARLRGEEGLG